MATKKAKGLSKKKSAAPSQEVIEKNLDGIAQAGVLMACADGEIEENEIAVLAGVLSEILGELGIELTEELFVGKIEQIVGQFDGKEGEEILGLIAGNLSDKKAAELALVVAAAVLASDEEFDEESEGGIYVALAEALKFSEAEYSKIFKDTLGIEE